MAGKSTTVPLARHEKTFWQKMREQKVLVFWAVIFFVFGFIFYYVPLGGWVIGFQEYKPKNGLFGSEFVGFAKFAQLFGDVTFLRTLRNTICMGVLNLVFCFVTAIAFAILLNEVKSKNGKKLVQTISYLPHFLSWIIVTGILHDMLSGSGIVNEILVGLHILDQPLNFFAYPQLFWGIVVFANVWKETGWNAIIYLAAITAIDPSLYEDQGGNASRHPAHHHDSASDERGQRPERGLRGPVPAGQWPGAERLPDHRHLRSEMGHQPG